MKIERYDVIIVGAGPAGLSAAIEAAKNGLKPVVFDENADLIYSYGIQAFPTTFVIDKEGYIAQYVPGGMTKEMMKTLIESVK